MLQYIFFLGSHPALSATECFAVLNREKFSPKIISAQNEFMVVEVNDDLPKDFLKTIGGTDRIARVIAKQADPWNAEQIFKTLPSVSKNKFTVGISTVGMPDGYNKETSKELKKVFKGEGKGMRFVLPAGRKTRLNAAQVLFNKLCEEPNRELWIVKHQDKFYLAETQEVQDIQAYEVRDTKRPLRDAKVGMLPPKLAQVMLNLVPNSDNSSMTIFDPFCGMGTILQEGWLMKHKMIGSDASDRMVDASTVNLDWVMSKFEVDKNNEPEVFEHDVRQHFPDNLHNSIDAVVTEPYLGKPISAPLPQDEVDERISSLSELYLRFFADISPTLKENAYILMVLPAVKKQSKNGEVFEYFPTSFIDHVSDIGYSLDQLVPKEIKQYFSSTSRDTLLYARPDAWVGREITLWKKK
jgi:tRNA G10  N-methylase Trm11